MDTAVGRERARGALLGLAVGDALGAPAENLRPSEIRRRWGRIEGFVSEDPAGADDTEYAIFSGLLLARHGSALDVSHVERAWHHWIADLDEGPFRGAGFSERGTLENLRRGLAAPISAQHRHAWSDGLAMRAAPFGVFAAGRPAEAARLVAVDGRVSHEGEGIYGGRAVAAGVAAAMVGSGLASVIAAALSVVPMDSWTASTTRCCSSGTAAPSPRPTWGVCGWTSCRPDASSPPSASRTAISSRASSPPRPPASATRSGSGSGRGSGPTCTAGRIPATRPGPPPRPTATRSSPIPATACTARCSPPPRSPWRPAARATCTAAWPPGCEWCRPTRGTPARSASASRPPVRRGTSTPSWTGCTPPTDTHHWVHALPNAALMAAALTHADGDFTRSVCGAVSGGWDTDSDGATAGSLAGLLAGVPDALPERWTAPLKNRLSTSVPGFDRTGFDTLAALTHQEAPRP